MRFLISMFFLAACGQDTVQQPGPAPNPGGGPPPIGDNKPHVPCNPDEPCGPGFHPPTGTFIPPLFDAPMSDASVADSASDAAPDASIQDAATPDAPLTPDSGPVCGNGVCENGEDCNTCSSDCGPCGGGGSGGTGGVGGTGGTPDAAVGGSGGSGDTPDAAVAPDAGPSYCPSCNRTRGYWDTHPNSWPLTNLTLGSVSYTETQLISILNNPTTMNGLVSLASQLIAAKLNTACGASSDIAALIAQADAMIGSLVVPPVGSDYLNPSTTSSLTDALDRFNSSNQCR